MLRSQRLRIGEVRKIHDLIGEITELGGDPPAWRAHALHGLCHLMHSQVAFTGDMADALPGRPLRPIQPIDIGWPTDAARRRFYQYFESGESMDDPGAHALLESHSRSRLVTVFRRQCVDDETWYTAPSVVNGRHFAEIDDFLVSSYAVRPGMLQGFVLYRDRQEPTFDMHDRRMMCVFHVLLLRLISENWSQDHPDELTETFSPRLRQTFQLLMLGTSSKEIANAMRLSLHTVNDYMKEIYRRLNVNSRAELMSKGLSSQKSNGRRVKLPSELVHAWVPRSDLQLS